MVIDQSKFVQKSGDYAIASAGGIADSLILATATKYEENMSRCFRGIAPAEIPTHFESEAQVLWTEKYDGEGVLVFYDSVTGAVAFSAPSGRARVGLPALKQAAAALAAGGFKKALLRAELYLPWKQGETRSGIAGVTRASFSTEKGASAELRLAFFDILMLDGRDLRDDGDFNGEWEILGRVFGEDLSCSVHRARGSWCRGRDLQKLLDRVVAAGGEGLVVRAERTRGFTKIKPRLSIDAAIIGYAEGAFEGRVGVRNLLVSLSYPAEGTSCVYQTLGRIGSGLGDKLAVELLDHLKQLKVGAPLLLNDSDGREVHFVRPRLIVEVSGEDWIRTRSDGKPVRTQAFAWCSQSLAWTFAGVAHCPRLVFPSFVRLREDKSVEEGGARVSQVRVDLQPPARRNESSAPEVLVREVYRKGKDSLRKFVLARTSNEEAVPFLFCFTDYSAGRKEPLKVTTEYAFTEGRARALLGASIAENVKKGWERVS